MTELVRNACSFLFVPASRPERLAKALASGADMGTDETCMGWVHDEIGRAVGKPESMGGIPLDELGATGWGRLHAAIIAAPYSGLVLAGARVAIQGFGAVGRHAARFLASKGAILVAAADSAGTIVDRRGLDIAMLTRLKAEGKGVCDYPGGDKLDPDAVIDADCDIWIPAARPGFRPTTRGSSSWAIRCSGW